MLEYYSKNATVTLAAANQETVVPFNTRSLQKGKSVVMSGNSADINCCGVYNVNVGACFSAGTVADVTFRLYVDNVAQPQAERTVSAATVDDFYTVDFSTYVTKQDNNCNCNPCTAPTNVYVTVSASVADVALTFETTDMQVYKATR